MDMSPLLDQGSEVTPGAWGYDSGYNCPSLGNLGKVWAGGDLEDGGEEGPGVTSSKVEPGTSVVVREPLSPCLHLANRAEVTPRIDPLLV